jgi:polar amino acid transport system substrate-binding protein
MTARHRPAGATRRARLLVLAGAVVPLVLTGCGLGLSDDSEGAAIDRSPDLVQDGTLTVCTSMPYEPFEFRENDEPVGFDVDLVNEVAKVLGVRTEIRNADFGAIESGRVLNDGTCDVAVAAITITGDRARVMDFSSPYFSATQTMVVPDDSGLDSLEDLSGRRIGVEAGSTGELYVTDNAPRDAEIVGYEFAADAEAALAADEVDAAIFDNTIVGDVVARNPGFEVARAFDTDEEYGMAVRKNSSVELLRTINDVLASLQSGDRYDAIYQKWFGETEQ